MPEPIAQTRPTPRWEFILYKAGEKDNMRRAETTLRHLCDRYLGEDYVLSIVDVMEEGATLPPDVLAVPTEVRTSPPPERRVVGDLSQTAKAAEWLGLTTAGRFYGE